MSHVYQPLHHKYRPDKFDELVGQDSISTTLKQAIISNKIAPAYIFSGPRGTGKTSSARILARSLNCLNCEQPTVEPCGKCSLCQAISIGTALDVIEIDAASNTGVENIRDLIDKSQFAPVQARWKVYVIDECHMLSTAAFNALLKTLEEPPAQVTFVLATTDPQRVLPTILSRCMRFDFRRIALQDLVKHLGMIAKEEEINITSDALGLIAKKSQGGLRDAESMLDQLSLLPNSITEASVYKLLGAVPEQELLKMAEGITQLDPISILKTSRNLLEEGKEPISILQGLASILRDLVLIKAAPEQPNLCSVSKDSIPKLNSIASNIELSKLLEWQSKLKGSEIQIRQSLQPRLWLEIIILGIISNDNKLNNKQIEVTKKYQTELHSQSLQEKIIKGRVATSGNALQPENKLPNPTNTSDKGKDDLSEQWSQIIAMMELPSTKMLLSQQAKLVRLNEKVAEISVSSKWINMLESRKNIIEEAIEKALGEKKNILFSTTTNFTIIKEDQNKNEISDSLKNLETKPVNNISKDESEKRVEIADMNKSTQISGEMAVNKKESIDMKAKGLADFFNGEIIDPEE